MNASKKSNERRRAPRKPCQFSIEYAIQDSNYTAFIQNISYGGGFIESSHSVNIGEAITIYLQFAEDQPPITMIGEVVRKNDQGFGVRFKMGIDASLIKSISNK